MLIILAVSLAIVACSPQQEGDGYEDEILEPYITAIDDFNTKVGEDFIVLSEQDKVELYVRIISDQLTVDDLKTELVNNYHGQTPPFVLSGVTSDDVTISVFTSNNWEEYNNFIAVFSMLYAEYRDSDIFIDEEVLYEIADLALGQLGYDRDL